jgi:hypothetical protein
VHGNSFSQRVDGRVRRNDGHVAATASSVAGWAKGPVATLKELAG